MQGVARLLSKLTLAVFVLAAVLSSAARAERASIRLAVRAEDSNGKPIPKFEAMLHSHEYQYSGWVIGTNGQCEFGVGNAIAVEEGETFYLIVRAPGLATAIVPRICNHDQAGEATVRLSAGRVLEVRLDPGDAVQQPPAEPPELVFEPFVDRTRGMRQPTNRRDGSDVDLAFAELEEVGAFEYRVTLPDECPPFLLTIDEPGYLRSADSPLFDADDIGSGRIEWMLPSPATLQVRLEVDPADEPIPYAKASVSLLHGNPAMDGSYYQLDARELDAAFDFAYEDLPPGKYLLQARLVGDGNASAGSRLEAAFSVSEQFELAAGQTDSRAYEYRTYDPDVWKGNSILDIHVDRYDGTPAEGAAAKLSYVDGNYGYMTVYEGPLDEHGELHLDGVGSRAADPGYWLTVDETLLGAFELPAEIKEHRRAYVLGPQVGDVIPNLELVELSTGDAVSTHDLIGLPTYLEFWATWCGPCQGPMAELSELVRSNADAWKGKLNVVALSIDQSADVLRKHVADRDWTAVRHLWIGDCERSKFRSVVEQRFGVSGVPMAFILDREGRILWSGNPHAVDTEQQLERVANGERPN